jgi:AhpD family alkylhydroperoxidase
MKFVVPTAAASARQDLTAAGRILGFVPNLLAVLAEAPIALRAYINLTELLGDPSLSPIEQQVTMLASSYEHCCGYCIAVHSTVATMAGMPEPGPVTLRRGNTKYLTETTHADD